MKKIFLRLSAVALIGLSVACTNERGSSERTDDATNDVAVENDSRKDDDKAEFLAEQIAANHVQLELARVATERSNHAEIKKVAQSLVEGHRKHLEELKSLASNKNIQVSEEMDRSKDDTLEDLREEKDLKEFNKEWCEEMVEKHEESIKSLQNEFESTEDEGIKTWIGNTLPSMRAHLDELKACHEKLKDA